MQTAAERGGSECLAERGSDASIVIVDSGPGNARWSCPQLMILRSTSKFSRATAIRLSGEPVHVILRLSSQNVVGIVREHRQYELGGEMRGSSTRRVTQPLETWYSTLFQLQSSLASLHLMQSNGGPRVDCELMPLARIARRQDDRHSGSTTAAGIHQHQVWMLGMHYARNYDLQPLVGSIRSVKRRA
ncbi:hypothetical protein CC86DRAFT_20527 [Ophiobolus disseminans]|uniref:Uncharacterized protein n=1 Tax=Ophiobolus disseminans TaxID=1469910 RepID=A0A6A7A0Y6_9PLEO|nr:hypothetical protein CC86DRAFT_20527 [Ophiobolus disseminans]